LTREEAEAASVEETYLDPLTNLYEVEYVPSYGNVNITNKIVESSHFIIFIALLVHQYQNLPIKSNINLELYP
jgi:hypothetical protein